MKKTFSALLALMLVLCSLSALGEQSGNEPTAAYLDDFTVTTADGSAFTLSEALKDHELVLINLWATWCGPCAYEFPFLQEAWMKNADKVAVIALSVEPKDTLEDVKAYAEDMGLTFPMGVTGDTGLEAFASQGTPTSVIIGKDSKIICVEVGVMTSAEDFEKLFEGYSGSNYNPDICTYTLHAVDEDQNPIAEVSFGLCTDTACRNVTTDGDGVAVFQGAPAQYHIQLVEAPDGYEQELEDDYYTEPFDQTIYIMIPKE